MANKELTARVKLDTKNAEQRLKNLAKAIDTINNAVNKQSSVYDAVNKALGETASKVNRVKQQTDRVKQSATEAGRSFNQIDNGVLKVSRSLDRVSVKLLNWSNRVPIIGNALDGIGRKFASISGRLHNLVSNSNRWSKVSNTLSTAFNKINGVKQQISQKVSGIVSKVHSWASAQSKVHSSTKNTNNLLSNTWNKLKGIAATYLGIIGTKAVINTSDTITSAENRLNSIEGGNPTATAETMDKIYQAANRARTSYTDMLAGASKSMTIAGDAFQGNIDNAIRFEEIMSKSFTVAGASADEMRNSM